MNLLSDETAKLVDLIRDPKCRSEMASCRVDRILSLNYHVLVPRMAVKIAPNEFAVFWPAVERVGGAMNASEALSGTNEIQQDFLLDI